MEAHQEIWEYATNIRHDKMMVIAHHTDGVYLNAVFFGGPSKAIDKHLIEEPVRTHEKAAPEATAGHHVGCPCQHVPRKRHALIFDRGLLMFPSFQPGKGVGKGGLYERPVMGSAYHV